MIDCDAYWQEHPPKKKDRDYFSKEQQKRAAEEAEKVPRLADDVGDGTAMCPCEQCHGLRPHPPSKFMWIDYDLIDPAKVGSLDLPGGPRGLKHRYLLCARRLMGYVLKSRKWGELILIWHMKATKLIDTHFTLIEILDVACCQDVGINTRAIERLVMPQDNKDMIKALVHRYAAGSNKGDSPPPWGTDFIEDKGHGRIFLLHGSPGVGKTYVSLHTISSVIARWRANPVVDSR